MNVLQRIGPTVATRTTVAPLDVAGPATEGEAARLRRSFRRWVSVVADDDTADDLTLAVYEALANAVDHAYHRADAPGPMRLWAAVSAPLHGGRDLVVTVSDDGTWRHCDDPGWRGRGLPLVRTLCTSASVFTTASGTTVQMRRRVDTAAVPA
jgi:anti-sigma regulatory factor (Ser/Thr protein kinase)